jgi:hypothetical protein
MDPPKKLMENIDIAKIAAAAIGVDLVEKTAELFVDLDTTDLEYSVDTSDVTNWFATVEGFVFPLGTDYFLMDDERIMLPCVTVYAPMIDKLFISQAAIELVKEMKK